MNFVRNRAHMASVLLILVLVFLSGCNINHETIIQETDNQQNNNQNVENTKLFSYLSEEDIDLDNIMSIIEELASKKYNGRLPGTPGNELAQEYIIDYFKNLGIESPNLLDNYKQYYKQDIIFNNSEPILETLDDKGNVIKKYDYLYEYGFGFGGKNKLNYETTAPGLYIESADQIYVDNEEVSGKVLLISKEALIELNSNIEKDSSVFEWMHSEDSGIEGIIGEINLRDPSQIRKYFSPSVISDYIDRSDEERGLLQIACNSPSFNGIKRTIEEGSLIHMKSEHSLETVDAANIIGLIPGVDEKLKNEYIIISAHYDHIGDNKDGTYNPGALDNASGVAVMMEIARILKSADVQPSKSIVFIAFSGEEEIYKGSSYYVENPVFPLNNSKVINLDMVGAKTMVKTLVADYYLDENELKDKLLECSKELIAGCEAGRTSRSDHSPFNTKGFEAVTIIQPDESNGYHSPDDTIDSISSDRIAPIVKVILYYIDKNAY